MKKFLEDTVVAFGAIGVYNVCQGLVGSTSGKALPSTPTDYFVIGSIWLFSCFALALLWLFLDTLATKKGE